MVSVDVNNINLNCVKVEMAVVALWSLWTKKLFMKIVLVAVCIRNSLCLSVCLSVCQSLSPSLLSSLPPSLSLCLSIFPSLPSLPTNPYSLCGRKPRFDLELPWRGAMELACLISPSESVHFPVVRTVGDN